MIVLFQIDAFAEGWRGAYLGILPKPISTSRSHHDLRMVNRMQPATYYVQLKWALRSHVKVSAGGNRACRRELYLGNPSLDELKVDPEGLPVAVIEIHLEDSCDTTRRVFQGIE